MIDCSVGIVTYNSARTIASTLRALRQHWPPELSGHVYVVDNGSTDETVTLIEQAVTDIGPLPVTLIHSANGNCGYGAAHNQVLPHLESRIHVLMNPDINVLNADSVRALVRRLDSEPQTGLVMPKIVDPDGQVQHLARRDLTILDLGLRYLPGRLLARRERYHTYQDQDYDQSFAIEFASGCLMAMRTADCRAIGGFDPRYFLYAEDADLSRMVRARGLVVLYDPASVVEHAWSRGSYRSFKMFRIHFHSLWLYFCKWGFKLA
jgi:GT2 family glycosyltransferase